MLDALIMMWLGTFILMTLAAFMGGIAAVMWLMRYIFRDVWR